MHITFICTGNTCRSPMAEGIARKIASEKWKDSNLTFSSAGLATYNGAPASQHSIDVCREIGIDLTPHRSQRLNPEILEKTGLFAVLSPEHAAILQYFGVSGDRIVLLGGGIPDPYGGDEDLYRSCRDEIYKAVQKLLEDINGKLSD
jgi:Protein-tyrosine-phosphatase